jgi:hypothetical protein
MTTKQRSRLVGGLVLILAGVFFGVLQPYPEVGRQMTEWVAWPLYVIGAGVLMFILGLLAGSPGMAVPACITAGIGGLLYYQNATGDWGSWSYAWALILGFIGVGIILEGLFKGRFGMGVRDGGWLLLLSGLLFVIMSSITGGPLDLGVYWPLLLILLGLWLMISALVGRHRRRDNFFWGLMLALLGGLFQVDYLGYLPNVDVWAVFLALFLMSLGGWLVLRGIFRRKSVEEPVSVALSGAAQAALVLKHAAGRLELKGADLGDKLVEGVCVGGASVRTLRVGEVLEAELTTRPVSSTSLDPDRLDWHLKANRALSYERLVLESGASDADLDLSELRVAEVKLKTGASATRVTAPAVGQTRLSADVGAAQLTVVVPDGVEASIRSTGGLFVLTVDEQRFPRQEQGYASPGFATAANRLEVEVSAGLGSVKVE